MNIEIRNQILPIGFLIVLFALYNYNKDLISGFIFLSVGGGFLYFGFYLRNTNRRIQTSGTKTRAKIIDFVEKPIIDADGDSHLYHFPIVSFIDLNGIEYTQKLDSSENPKRINKQIDIIYLKKEDEYEIIKDNDLLEKNLPIIFIIGGLLFFGIGIVWLINKV